MTEILTACAIAGAILITIFLVWYKINVYEPIKKEQKEGAKDTITPDFTRRAGEGLETIKKYGIWF